MQRPDSRSTPPAQPGLARTFPPLRYVLAVAAGGALGGWLRHALAAAFSAPGQAFPWVVFAVNAAGAFLLGLLLTVLQQRWPHCVALRLFLATGVLGAFTTFSNYSLDGVVLAGRGSVGLALAYGVGSIAAGLAACGAGLAIGRGITASRP